MNTRNWTMPRPPQLVTLDPAPLPDPPEWAADATVTGRLGDALRGLRDRLPARAPWAPSDLGAQARDRLAADPVERRGDGARRRGRGRAHRRDRAGVRHGRRRLLGGRLRERPRTAQAGVPGRLGHARLRPARRDRARRRGPPGDRGLRRRRPRHGAWASSPRWCRNACRSPCWSSTTAATGCCATTRPAAATPRSASTSSARTSSALAAAFGLPATAVPSIGDGLAGALAKAVGSRRAAPRARARPAHPAAHHVAALARGLASSCDAEHIVRWTIAIYRDGTRADTGYRLLASKETHHDCQQSPFRSAPGPVAQARPPAAVRSGLQMGTDGPPPPPPFDGPVDDEQPGPAAAGAPPRRTALRSGLRPGHGPPASPAASADRAAAAGAPPAATSAPRCSRWSPSSRGTATRSSRRSPSGPVGPGAPAPARSTPRSRSWRTRASSASSRPTAAGSSTSPRRAPATSRSTAPSSTRCGSRSTASDDDATALFEQLGQLHAAAQQVISAGTPAQITAATAALAEARKTIYRLLAE